MSKIVHNELTSSNFQFILRIDRADINGETISRKEYKCRLIEIIVCSCIWTLLSKLSKLSQMPVDLAGLCTSRDLMPKHAKLKEEIRL